MKTGRCIGPSCLVFMAMLAGPAAAEDAAAQVASALAPLTELPPVVVPLPPEEPAPETPTRRDPTGTVTVIDLSARRGEALVASDLVAVAPGVLTQERGGVLQTRTLSIRGAASNGVLVLLDGVPLNGAGGTVDLSRIPVAIVERFELLRGSGGALYGSGGLGGVLNVVTKKPAQGFVASGGLTYGSFGTATGQVTASGALLGGAGLVVLHGGRTGGDFPFLLDRRTLTDDEPPQQAIRRNNDVTLAGALLRYRRALSEEVHLDASVEYAQDRRGLAGTMYNPTPDLRMRSDRFTANARTTHRLDRGEWAVRAHLNHETNRIGGAPQPLIGAGIEGTAQYLLGEHHGLSAAVTLGYDGLELAADQAHRWLKAGVTLADELLFWNGDVSLFPTLRVDRTGPFTTVSPKVGARVGLPRGFELRANAGQAHRAPSFLELYVHQGTLLPNPALRPERALTVDLGAGHRTESTWVALTAFYNLYEDLIAYELYPPFLARPFNFNAARAMGLEAEVDVRPNEFVSASASYTWMQTQNLRDDVRYYLREIPYRPQHRVFARVSAGVPVVRARAEVDFQSSQFINRTNTQTLPDRAFVHAGLTVTPPQAPGLTAALDVKNLLDVQSADLAGYPLPGRAFFLTVSFTLGDEKS